MTDWAGLHGDFIGSIIEKISSVEDFVVFGSVCKSWNSEAASNKNNLRRCPQVPWLMVADRDTDTTGNQQIHILRKESTFFTKNLYVPEMSHKSCIGLNYGWVLTLSKSKMNLVHPISRHCFQLPETDFITRAALSADPLESASDFVVMIVHMDGGMSYWKPGVERWTRVEKQQDHQFYKDVTYYQDQFYGLTYSEIWGFKFSSGSGCSSNTNININTRLVAKYDYMAAYRNRLCFSHRNRPYIVGSESGLLVVATDMKHGSDKFHVYELDWINAGSAAGYVMRMIKSLGDRSIFVGQNNMSISFDHASQYPQLKSNRIYFTDSYDYIGSYNLEDAQIQRFDVVDKYTVWDYPFWSIPSL